MKRWLLLLIGAAGLTLAFQNCGKAGFEEGGLDTTDLSSTSVDPKLSNVAFPYDISVNQIAHMSCAMNVAPNVSTPYFSWKVAAFDNPADVPTAAMNIRASGLKLRPEFITNFNNLSVGKSAGAKSDYLRKILKTHPSVGAGQLQISFRDTVTPRTKLMQMPTGGNSPVSLLMAPLGVDGIADNFVKDSTKTYDFFPGVPENSKKSLEGKLIVPSAYGFNHNALMANYDASYMTVAVQTDTSSTNLSGADDTKAYGKAFKVIYSQSNPHQGTNYYPAKDSLVGLTEYDLDTRQTTGAGWDCSYRFKIVKSQDRYSTHYRKDNFARIGGACPGPTLTGTYCESPVAPGFGLSNTFFPSAQCPSNRAFKTGSYCVEKYATVCPAEPYNANSSSATPYDRTDGLYNPNYPERARIFHALRRMLPTSEWDINVSRGCIVAKSDDNACYQNQNSIVYDEYFSSLIDANVSMGRHPGCGVDIAGVGGTYPCAAYLTLCIRR